MQKIDKNVLMFLGILVILVIIFLSYRQFKKGSEVPLADRSGVEDTTGDAVPPTKLLKYGEALSLYKDKRIQLDTKCQASPNNATFKNNTKIMIDNRSAVTRTVKVGSVMTIKPWSFRIVNLSASTLPATWLMDCDKSQNVATLLIQK